MQIIEKYERDADLKKKGKCSCACGSVVEHCVSTAKVVGSIPREHTHCKSLWIKASAKYINVNVNGAGVLSV